MFLYYLYFYIILRSSSYAQKAEQVEEAENKRYFIPDDKVKQPIFGSKKYNPVIQQFECIYDVRASPINPAPLILDVVSTMETMSRSVASPEVKSMVERTGISTTEAAQPVISSTETPTTASGSLRGQHIATKIWWQKTTKVTPTRQQNKGGKKKIIRKEVAKTLV